MVLLIPSHPFPPSCLCSRQSLLGSNWSPLPSPSFTLSFCLLPPARWVFISADNENYLWMCKTDAGPGPAQTNGVRVIGDLTPATVPAPRYPGWNPLLLCRTLWKLLSSLLVALYHSFSFILESLLGKEALPVSLILLIRKHSFSINIYIGGNRGVSIILATRKKEMLL